MSVQLFIGGIGGPELVIVLFLVVLLFGANKLPKLARASGEAMGEFQKGRAQIEREIRDATRTPTAADAGADAPAVGAAGVGDVDAGGDADADVVSDHPEPESGTALDTDVDADGGVERDRAPAA